MHSYIANLSKANIIKPHNATRIQTLANLVIYTNQNYDEKIFHISTIAIVDSHQHTFLEKFYKYGERNQSFHSVHDSNGEFQRAERPNPSNVQAEGEHRQIT